MRGGAPGLLQIAAATMTTITTITTNYSYGDDDEEEDAASSTTSRQPPGHHVLLNVDYYEVAGELSCWLQDAFCLYGTTSPPPLP